MLDYVRRKLPSPKDKQALEAVAKAASVPYHTLLKIANGQTADPRVSTVQSLYNHLRGQRAA